MKTSPYAVQKGSATGLLASRCAQRNTLAGVVARDDENASKRLWADIGEPELLDSPPMSRSSALKVLGMVLASWAVPLAILAAIAWVGSNGK